MTGIKRNSTGTKIHNGCNTERDRKQKQNQKNNPTLQTVNLCEVKADLILPLTGKLIEASLRSKQQKREAG